MKIEQQKLFTIEIYKELKNGNTGRTKHWSSAAKDRKAWMNAIGKCDITTETGVVLPAVTFLEDVLNGDPVAEPVGLVVERVLGVRQRLWDADSTLRGAKELIDSVVEWGFLHDDNHKFVKWCVGLQDDTCKEEGPYVRVHFYAA